MQHGAVLRGQKVDASANRERKRQRRLASLVVILGVPVAWFWYRELSGNPIHPGIPSIITDSPELAILGLMLIMITGMMMIPMMASGKSPHTMLRPSDSTIRLADVVGADATRREAIDTLNLFLNHETFADEMGGSSRRGVLFEGAPGTGKTYLAKAIAAEADVPFLFVSASEFQSHFYGMTNRKIRQFFKALRKAARAEGGAIGFIEEFDAIGMARSGMGTGGMREGAAGIVNELLVQMQSFDLPTGRRQAEGEGDRLAQPAAASGQGATATEGEAGQRPGLRGNQPRRWSRSGADAPGPVRPHDPLRSAAAKRPYRDRCLLPGEEVARGLGQRRRHRRPHCRLQPRSYRAAPRRGADHRPPRRTKGADHRRPRRGADDRRGRSRPGRRIPARRAPPDCGARGRPCGDRRARRPRRSGCLDPSSLELTRSGRPRRRRGTAPAHAVGVARSHRRRPRPDALQRSRSTARLRPESPRIWQQPPTSLPS